MASADYKVNLLFKCEKHYYINMLLFGDATKKWHLFMFNKMIVTV